MSPHRWGMELHHSSQQEAYRKVTKLFLNTPLVVVILDFDMTFDDCIS